MRRSITILLAALCMAASAQERRLTLSQCIDMAMRQNPSVMAAAKSAERSKALQGTAWDVGKTELSLSQDPTSGGSPDNSLALSQTIDFPTLYIARRKQLKAETRAEESRSLMVASDIRNEVKERYWQLVFQMEKLRILTSQGSVLERYQAIATKRYEAGETRKLEVLTAERLRKENRMELSAARSEAEEALQSLRILLSTDEDITPADTLLRPIDFVQRSFDYNNTPAGQYGRDQLNAASRAVTTARNGYAPTISVALKNQLVLSGWNPYDQDRSRFEGGNFMGFEVGVGIPLFYGATKAKVRAAKKEREIAELEMKQERQTKEKEYLAALSRCNSAHERMTYYTQEGEAKAGELSQLASLEYENGEIGYVEYISALQESIAVRLKAAEAVNDFNQSVLQLERINPAD